MPIYKTDKVKDGKSQYRVFVSYTDPLGKYRKITRTVYGAAEARQEEMRIKYELGNKSAIGSFTLNQLFDEYVATKRFEVRKATIEKSIRVLKLNVLPFLGDKHIDKLNVRVLQDWKNRIAARDLKVTSKNNIYREFRTLLNYAVKMEYLPKNPLLSVGGFKDAYNFEKPQDTLRYYTADQFKQFIAIAEQACSSITDYGYYVFFCIAFYTGMRKGEINALKWSDIEENIIHVRRSISQKVKGSYEETPPKNRSSYRDLQMPKQLIEILNKHKNRHMQFKEYSDDFRVCGGATTLSDTMISNKNIRFADAAGLPHIRVHDFRHTHATLLINEGINIQEIARRLGHSKVEITWSTYAHLYPREEERAVKILEAI